MPNKNKLILSLTALFSAVLILFTSAVPANAATSSTAAHNWYVMRTKDHSQPKLETSMSFISEHQGYYVDKKHTDAEVDDKVVYLTFDAGYENGNVERILNTLNEKNATGAFFILENLIVRNPELVLRMRDEGHLICNHTCRHKDMSAVCDFDEFAAELAALEACYTELTGEEMPKYYRPPEGRFSEQNLEFCEQLNYKTIFWSFAYADWDNDKQPSAEDALKIILDNIHNGAVLLLHPTSKTNADILGTLIDTLRADGYRFGTLDELTAQKEAR